MLLAAAIGDSQPFKRSGAGRRTTSGAPTDCSSFLWRRRSRGRPSGRLRRRPGRQPCAARRRLPLPPPALRQEAIQLGDAIMRVEVAYWQGDARCSRPARGRSPRRSRSTPATSRPPRSRRCRPPPATLAGVRLAASSRSITSALMRPPSRLPPDWARLEGGRPVAIGMPSEPADATAIRLRCRTHAGPDGRGSEPGRPADRRQGVARVRRAGPDQTARRTQALRPADRQHPESRRARGRGRGGRCRRKTWPRGTGCSRRRNPRPAVPDLLRRRLGGARADHAHHEASSTPARRRQRLTAPRRRPRVRSCRKTAAVGRSSGALAIARRMHVLERRGARRAGARAPRAARR